MYSLSGMATISASVSSSTGLVFQLLASLGSRLATRERGAEMVVVIVFASQQRRPRLPGDGWVAGVRRCGLPLPEQAGAIVSTPVPKAAFISHGLVGQGRTNANPRVNPQPRNRATPLTPAPPDSDRGPGARCPGAGRCQ